MSVTCSPKLLLFFGATPITVPKVKRMSERSAKLSDTVGLRKVDDQCPELLFRT